MPASRFHGILRYVWNRDRQKVSFYEFILEILITNFLMFLFRLREQMKNNYEVDVNHRREYVRTFSNGGGKLSSEL